MADSPWVREALALVERVAVARGRRVSLRPYPGYTTKSIRGARAMHEEHERSALRHLRALLREKENEP